MEKVTYKEFRVVVKDRNAYEFFRPGGTSFRGLLERDELREQTIKIFHRWLAADQIVSQPEVFRVLGSYLYKELFQDEISRAFKDEFDKVQSKSSERLRVILEFEKEAGELAAMPWEYIYYPDPPGFFIGAYSKLVLARHVSIEEVVKPPDEQPLRLLIVVSKPKEKEFSAIDPGEVINTIKNLPSVQVYELPQPNKRSLTRAVKAHTPHVVHFIGHGSYSKDKDEGSVALMRDTDQIILHDPDDDDQLSYRWTNEKDFADCFMEHPPGLIFLHACEGARTESYQAFKGVALQLIRSGIPAVVAMQYEVENLVANSFAKKFYEALGEGAPIDAAVQEGRIELGHYDEPGFGNRAFGSPVIYLRKSKSKGKNTRGIILVEAQSERKGPRPKAPPTEKVPCPYPDCKKGMVRPGDNFCFECRDPLMLCPNCGNVIAKKIPFCVKCGFSGEVSSSRAEAPSPSARADTPQDSSSFGADVSLPSASGHVPSGALRTDNP